MGLILSFVFTILHDPKNIMVAISMFTFDLTSCILIYVTGGIEVGIIMHAINNGVLFILTILSNNSLNFKANQAGIGVTLDAFIGTLANVVFFLIILWV